MCLIGGQRAAAMNQLVCPLPALSGRVYSIGNRQPPPVALRVRLALRFTWRALHALALLLLRRTLCAVFCAGRVGLVGATFAIFSSHDLPPFPLPIASRAPSSGRSRRVSGTGSSDPSGT